MAAIFAVVVSTFLAGTEADPRFFIGYHQTIIDVDNPYAYTIDVCSNTEVIYFGTEADQLLYSKFTCNDEGTEVTETTYGWDSNCTAANANTTTTYSNTSLSAGEQWSFNCTGDEDYVSFASFRDDDTCCDNREGNKITVIAATGLCYAYNEGFYSKYECDGEGNFERVTYNDSDCTMTVTLDDYAYPGYIMNDSCIYHSTVFQYTMYRTLDYCVLDGNVTTNEVVQCANATFFDTTDIDDDSAALNARPWAGIGLFVVSCMFWSS